MYRSLNDWGLILPQTLADELLALKETNKRLDIENKNLVNVAERLTSLESDLVWPLLDLLTFRLQNHNKFVGVLIDGDGMPVLEYVRVADYSSLNPCSSKGRKEVAMQLMDLLPRQGIVCKMRSHLKQRSGSSS